MFSRTQKKKRHPLLAFGIGAMAIFGTYSLVSAVCDVCREKTKALMQAMKRKKNTCQSDDCCDTDDDC
jgi:hypothetical protein